MSQRFHETESYLTKIKSREQCKKSFSSLFHYEFPYVAKNERSELKVRRKKFSRLSVQKIEKKRNKNKGAMI